MKTKLLKPLMFLSTITLIGCKRVIIDNNTPGSNTSNTTTDVSVADTASTGGEIKHNYSTAWEHDETKHWHSCSDIGYENLRKDEEEHTFVESSKTEPTYESDGNLIETCSVCGYEKITNIPKLEHEYSTLWEHDETKHWHSCSDAGYENLKKDEEEHIFVESPQSTDATFEDDGKKIEVCSICNYEKITTIPKLEHEYSTLWEHDETKHWHECSDAGYGYLKKDEASHSFVESSRTEPTYESDGNLIETCSVCGYEKITNIPQLVHSYSDQWSSDEKYHFHQCIDQGYNSLRKDSTLHQYELVNGSLVCNTCNHISGLKFALNSDGNSYSIKGINDNSITEVIIPESIDNKPVTKIDYEAFYGSSLTSVNIPNSVSEIYYEAFQECESLRSIYIPSSVSFIRDGAFAKCISLVSIEVDEGNSTYKSDGNCLIQKNNNSLVLGCQTSIIPNDVTAICSCAFWHCISLTSINIPNSVTSIGSAGFSECSSLTSINIPSSVTSIGSQAFLDCNSLNTITVDDDNPKYKAVGNCLIEKGRNNLIAGCNTSIIPDDVGSIDNSAFSSRSSLSSIVIPDGVAYIGMSAFEKCISLSSIVIPTSIEGFGSWVFRGCCSLTHIYYTGTQSSWQNINMNDGDPEDYADFTADKIYFYSETQPTESGNYWHYDTDGITPIDWPENN